MYVAIRLAVFLLLASGTVAAARVARGPILPELPPTRPAAVPELVAREAAPYLGDSLQAIVARRDLFRFDRRPAPAPYTPEALTIGEPASAEPAPVPGPRPALALLGFVHGRKPTAIIDGFPGTDGPRIVGVGETVGAFRVMGLTDGVVEIAGPDTVWMLSLRVPWQ